MSTSYLHGYLNGLRRARVIARECYGSRTTSALHEIRREVERLQQQAKNKTYDADNNANGGPGVSIDPSGSGGEG